jgi:transposase
MKHKEGIEREQLLLFPAYLDEIIGKDNYVRLIDVFVEQYPLEANNFKIPKLSTGRPPYNPKDLLKMYMYCYNEKIRSSRGIEKECSRNIELKWLVKDIVPDHKTISNFRKMDRKALTNIFSSFVKLCINEGLIDLKVTAIDGTKIRGQNSLNEVYSKDRLELTEKKLSERFNLYLNQLDEADRNNDITIDKDKIENIVKRIKNKQNKIKDAKEYFKNNLFENRYYGTDKDSRMQSDGGKKRPGYNCQTICDDKNKLIAGNKVTNKCNDLNLMSEMVDELVMVKEESEVNKDTELLFDAGYDNEQEILKNNERENISINVCSKEDEIQRKKAKRPIKKKDKVPQEGFERKDFIYDSENNVFICPAGKELRKSHKNPGKEKSGKPVYEYKCFDCAGCKERSKCTTNKKGRAIKASARINEINTYYNSMRTKKKKELLSMRKEIVEHPFGTIKRHMGFTYFLCRGLEAVQAEYSFTCFIYNFKRFLSIYKFDEIMRIFKEKVKGLVVNKEMVLLE